MSDVVVIGADANGLVAAHLLARAGHKVTLVQEHAARERTSGWVPAALARELALDVAVEWPDSAMDRCSRVVD